MPSMAMNAVISYEDIEQTLSGIIIWKDGVWRGGVWEHGVWKGGIWERGVWKDGIWKGGTWKDKKDRLRYMLAILGIAFDENNNAIAYRTTNADYTGRYATDFLQPVGKFYLPEGEYMPKGSGTCVPGIHVSSLKIAYMYFGVDDTAQLWRVNLNYEDVLDCDGEKARIRGGVFTPIPWPWI